MKYILINPVVDSMYEKEELDEVLFRHGYQRAECQESWGPVVKEKYNELLKTTEKTVIDARCPVAAQKVKEEYQQEHLLVAEIEPILLHCAREISNQEELKGYEKVITTPCKALADQGNRLNLEETKFIAWNEFERTLDVTLESRKLSASPIPPGFFGDMEFANDSISGKEIIEEYFESETSRKMKLIEMLYCQQGCHNGDGVIKYE